MIRCSSDVYRFKFSMYELFRLTIFEIKIFACIEINSCNLSIGTLMLILATSYTIGVFFFTGGSMQKEYIFQLRDIFSFSTCVLTDSSIANCKYVHAAATWKSHYQSVCLIELYDTNTTSQRHIQLDRSSTFIKGQFVIYVMW